MVRRRVEAEAPTQNHARVRQAERLPAVPADELTFRALLPEAAADILLTGAATRRPRAIELVGGAGVLADLRVGARGPEPLDVGPASRNGREVVGRSVEELDGAIGQSHTMLATYVGLAR